MFSPEPPTAYDLAKGRYLAILTELTNDTRDDDELTRDAAVYTLVLITLSAVPVDLLRVTIMHLTVACHNVPEGKARDVLSLLVDDLEKVLQRHQESPEKESPSS